MISKPIISRRKGRRLWKFKYPLILVIAMLAMILSLAAPVSALSTLDQSQEVHDRGTTLYNSSFHTKVAQSFTAGATGQLEKISVYLGNSSGSTSPVTAEIWGLSGATPNAYDVLATTSAVVSSGSNWKDFVFASPPSLTTGTGYAIVLTGPNAIIWYGSDTSTYANGMSLSLDTNNTPDTSDDYWRASSTEGIGDFAFRTYRLLHTPTNISLSKNNVPEREPAGTTVGTFSTTDVDSGDSFAYTLVSGDGSTDNASFTISGNTLLTAARFDYETKNSYSIRVRTTDAAGLYFEKAFTINVTYVPPIQDLDQQVTPGTSYSNLSGYNYDQYGQTFTAGLSGNLSKVSLYITNNDTISVTMQIQGTAGGIPNGTVLATTTVNIPAYSAGRWVDFDFSSPASVTSDSQYALVFNPFNSLGENTDYSGGQAVAHFSSSWVAATNVAQDFVFQTYVTEVPPNLPPTNINLSNSTVAENQHAGALAGTFNTTDPNGADIFAYSLVAGEGDTDNALFSISGSNLVTATMLDYEAKPSLSIRVRSTDQAGLYFEKVFTITVTNVTPSLQIDQQQPNATNGANLLGWNYDQYGQTFTAGLSGNLEKVSFWFDRLEPITVTVEIQGVTGGLPNGTVLASTTVTVPATAAFGQWVDFNYSSPAYVTCGRQYAAVLSPIFNTVWFNNSNTYSGGQVVARAGSSWTGVISASIPDFAFKTYVIEASVYTVTFDSQGGSAVVSQPVTHGDKATEPTAPSREGYTFGGWYTDTTYTTAWNFTTDAVTSNITLYAKWTVLPTYSVTYNGNGHTGGSLPTDSNTYYQGDTVTVLGNTGSLIKTGYSFAGWNTAANGSGTTYTEGQTFTMDSSNITLYAKWTINQYTITFNSNGGSAVTTITQDYGSTVSAPTAPTKTGYTFAGWYSDEALNTAYTFTTMQAENITLYAKWTALPTYSVTYNGNGHTGGSLPTDSNTYYQGDTVTVLGNTGNLIKTGYSFAGWNTAANGSGTTYTDGQTFTMGSSNVTLYAKWTINQYTITFNSNGGSSVTAITQNYGSTVSAPTAPTKTGYTFAGWYSDEALTTAYTFTTMPAENITLYAKWTAMPTYSVTYNGNGHTGGAVPVDNNSYLTGATVTVQGNSGSLVKTGYSFAGWNTAANGSGTTYTEGQTFTMGSSNVTLYANWTINQYTITFNSNGGSSVTAITQNYGTTVSAPTAPTKTGYTFAGWYSDEALTTAYTFTTMPAENITLYAKWTALLTYSVIYNGNDHTGGSLPTDSNTYYQGDTVTVLGNTGNLIKTGYSYAGWNTAANGSGTTYTEGQTFTMGSSNVTLYANWTINEQDPIITAQPQNTEVAVGEQASFTVECNGFTEPAFQWQLSTNKGRKWSNITGADTDTYTTPAATSKMNGYQYRVILSDNLGSITSDVAILTVTAAPAAVADITIAKTGIYNPVTNTVAWTIMVTNSGPDAAEGVVVTDNLSNNTRVLSVTTDYIYKVNGKKVIFEIGSLENESSVQISVIEALVVRATGEVTNTATVTTTSFDPDLTNNTDTKSITI